MSFWTSDCCDEDDDETMRCRFLVENLIGVSGGDMSDSWLLEGFCVSGILLKCVYKLYII